MMPWLDAEICVKIKTKDKTRIHIFHSKICLEKAMDIIRCQMKTSTKKKRIPDVNANEICCVEYIISANDKAEICHHEILEERRVKLSD